MPRKKSPDAAPDNSVRLGSLTFAEKTPATMKAVEKLAKEPEIQEAIRGALALTGLDKESQQKFVTRMWEWLESDNPKLQITAANLLGRAILTTHSGKEGPKDLPIKDVEEGMKRMLGDVEGKVQ